MMSPADFAAYHVPALAKNESKHCLILAILARVRVSAPGNGFMYWSLGEPGACAAKSGSHPIVLGDLDEAQCDALAEQQLRSTIPALSDRI
jgi:hypothetical protein